MRRPAVNSVERVLEQVLSRCIGGMVLLFFKAMFTSYNKSMYGGLDNRGKSMHGYVSLLCK